ncbi:hypothetical protein [Sphingobium boeckii]|uniref:Post-segregation antitoxin (Ccd killing protein) n=1 Tax=Sphingobium boeckii TaxID=1082345 RepID=A0A7W9EEG2_9SPHN|nr:hypothetical protein [Sphingobium boeckii]MBB5686147.1 post-segregation antitoxin (ccd killing protein) [Sphingobium boeckii]
MAGGFEEQEARGTALVPVSLPENHLAHRHQAGWARSAIRRLGLPADTAIEYRYTRIEERWEIVLRPDGSPASALVARREDSTTSNEHWRYLAQRRLPQVRKRRRLAIGLIAAATASLATATFAWTTSPGRVGSRGLLVVPLEQPAPATHKRASASRIAKPAKASVAMAVTPASDTLAPAPAGAFALPIDMRAAVQAALVRAFSSGETESWSEGALEGFAVVGPVDSDAGGNCRNTVVLARGDGANRTFSHRRCLMVDGRLVVRDEAGVE